MQRDRDATTGERIAEPAVLVEVFATAAAAMGVDVGQARARLSVSHAPLADAVAEWVDKTQAGFDVASHGRAMAVASVATSAQPSFASTGSLPVPTEIPVVFADIKQVTRAITRPVSEYLRALQVRPQTLEDLIDTIHEPVELDSLEKWALDHALREWARDGHSEAEAKRRARCQGLLPHGEGCAVEWSARWTDATQFSQLQRDAEAAGQHVIVRERQREDRDITHWIEHIDIVARVPGAKVVAIEVGRGSPPQVAELPEIRSEVAREILSEVMALATRARSELLPFHGALMKHWRAARKDTDESRRRERLLTTFSDNWFGPALADDAEITTAFRGEKFFDYGSTGSTLALPRSFDHLAAWIDERMARVGWGTEAKK